VPGAGCYGRPAAGRCGRFAVAGIAGPSGAEQGDKRSAEDAREYVRLRSLLVDQILRDVLFSLLHAAQLKLGRRDARLLIDMTAVAHEHARPYLPGELTRQIDQVPGQRGWVR
jgi:hypothetical protein